MSSLLDGYVLPLDVNMPDAICNSQYMLDNDASMLIIPFVTRICSMPIYLVFVKLTTIDDLAS